MANETQAIQKLDAILNTAVKVGNETRSLLERIAALIAEAGQSNVPANVLSKIDEVAAQMNVVDALVADLPTVPTPTPDPEPDPTDPPTPAPDA